MKSSQLLSTLRRESFLIIRSQKAPSSLRRTFVCTPARFEASPTQNEPSRPASANASPRTASPGDPSPPPIAPRAKPRSGSSPLRIWPLVIIFAGGTFAFTQLVKQRQGTAPQQKNASSKLF